MLNGPGRDAGSAGDAGHHDSQRYLETITVEPTPGSLHDRIRGCLMAGALGDALGAPVEFWSLNQIRARLGPAGVTGFVDDAPVVTDDTQMTLFTAEGLLRAAVRSRTKGICHPASVVFNAYKRWLCTQHVRPEPGIPFDGWLVHERRLHHRRAPGGTCLSAIEAGWSESFPQAANDSKGCGTVMRVAPIGLITIDPDAAYQLAIETSATTHGHPSGQLPAGVLAAAIWQLLRGADLASALRDAQRLLPHSDGDPRTGETAAALNAAIALAGKGRATPERVEQLGGGWVAEEALAIACYCALSIPDPYEAILAAVNHSGDSDSTGSICGNLVGTLHGVSAVPTHLFAQLDVADIITAMADDLWYVISDASRGSRNVPDFWWDRYPGW